jgi:penicillin-binding protein 1C
MKKYIRDINNKIKKQKYVLTSPKKIAEHAKKNARVYIKYAVYAFLGFLALIFALVLFYITTVPLPDISNFDKRVISQSTKIYDRTGKILLYDNHNTIRRTVVGLEQINPIIADAAISIEDDQFYNHHGIRIKSLARAFVSTIFKGETQGGSTLTQQIVKNTLLTREKTMTRKIKEMIIAVRLEQKLTKNEILEIYLNEAPYSGNVYGVEEASQVYFKKKAIDVNLREASYLAAIPQSPVYYDPNGKNRTELDVRANYVLKRMETLGYITKKQHEEAIKTEVYFVPKAQSAVKAPHFVFWLRQYLIEKYGEDKVNKEGLRVTSTLDFELQSYAEEEALKEALKNEKEYGGSNIALVAIDPNNGHILSMIGSRDFFDKNIDGQFNVATAARQPGSAFKPFVYATAFKKGYRPETVLFDAKTEFNASCTPDGKGTDCYSPEDFDKKWKGPIQLKNALAESRNIPAVKLLYLAGVVDSISTARSMGITTLGNPKIYGLSLVLGAGEVRPLDMASAYGTFATGGIRHESTGILKVEDKSGKILKEWKQTEGEQVLPDYVASNISSILSNEDFRAPTFGRGSSLNVPGYSVAVKTGTTNNSRDAWIVGYSPKISIAVWSGNNNNTPMKKGGAQVSGPLFNKVIKKYLDKVGEESFPVIPMPETGGAPILRGLWQGGESFFIDKISGGLATDFTPDAAKLEKVITNTHSILYWVDKNNPTGPSPTDPYSDPQFKNWEYGVQNWISSNGVSGGASRASMPNYYDNVHTGIKQIPISILGISDGDEINYDQIVKISTIIDSQDIKNVKFFIDSREISNMTIMPYEYELDFNKLKLKDGPHLIKAVVYDNLLYSGEDIVSFNFKNKTETTPVE